MVGYLSDMHTSVLINLELGWLICSMCRLGLAEARGTEACGIKNPIRCYACREVVGRDTLIKVDFKVAPYTYEEPFRRLLRERSEIL